MFNRDQKYLPYYLTSHKKDCMCNLGLNMSELRYCKMRSHRRFSQDDFTLAKWFVVLLKIVMITNVRKANAIKYLLIYIGWSITNYCYGIIPQQLENFQADYAQ